MYNDELPEPRYRGRPSSVKTLEKLGREQLSRHFFMRNFLYSEIGAFEGIPNIPDDPALAVRAGRALAQTLLEPLVETFGPIEVRSAYRSPEVNDFGNRNGLNCASIEANRASHIWDQRDAEGNLGACSSIVIPWFARKFEAGRDWKDLAWWMHDHLDYHAMTFFPTRAAFNLTWRENPERKISSWIGPTRTLLASGCEPNEPLAARQQGYADFPTFRGIRYPE
ncbi:hypothetical protein N5A93_16140 [Roseovarius sp. EGI FJ00037]|uniref:hypothetical protein n=1 Tax=Roseovarius salincola TaxID=2978479 RepID=UPI0022A8BE41|nr:hypothetical protein [Roseovarius sp. EGI FJ00037]MCZ0813760.1 hypothetical protein [Roseovarius sp. EGI FJ00037]